MIPDLSTKSLRAFVAVASLGSVARAASLLNRSDSAVSLQINALERDLDHMLFHRTGRGLSLTEFGARFLVHAEEILARIDTARQDASVGRDAGEVRIGVVQDLLKICLPLTLDAVRDVGSSSGIVMRTGTSADLAVALGEGRLDLAIIARRHEEPDTLLTLPMTWLAAPGLPRSTPLPLVAVSPPCPFLDAAKRALEFTGLRDDLRFSSHSLEAVRLAAGKGAGVLCRTPLAAAGGLEDVTARLDLPPLPSISYALDIARDAGSLVRSLAEHLRAAIPMAAPPAEDMLTKAIEA